MSIYLSKRLWSPGVIGGVKEGAIPCISSTTFTSMIQMILSCKYDLVSFHHANFIHFYSYSHSYGYFICLYCLTKWSSAQLKGQPVKSPKLVNCEDLVSKNCPQTLKSVFQALKNNCSSFSQSSWIFSTFKQTFYWYFLPALEYSIFCIFMNTTSLILASFSATALIL